VAAAVFQISAKQNDDARCRCPDGHQYIVVDERNHGGVYAGALTNNSIGMRDINESDQDYRRGYCERRHADLLGGNAESISLLHATGVEQCGDDG
jgi:hypothetical protein